MVGEEGPLTKRSPLLPSSWRPATGKKRIGQCPSEKKAKGEKGNFGDYWHNSEFLAKMVGSGARPAGKADSPGTQTFSGRRRTLTR